MTLKGAFRLASALAIATASWGVKAAFLLAVSMTQTEVMLPGAITGGPINCNTTPLVTYYTSVCSANVQAGVTVTLAATPGFGFVFLGWSGDCIGSGDCTVVMNADKAVMANFAYAPGYYGLGTSGTGTGGGVIRSDPVVIQCGLRSSGFRYPCSAVFTAGTQVTLTAEPFLGSVFDGWSGGGCSGTDPCTVTMDQHRVVQAAFRAVPPEPLGDLEPVSDAAALSAGAGYACILTNAHGVKCWGRRDITGGIAYDRPAADDVPNLTSGVVAISAGSAHACAITMAGGVKCWGSNGYGQLGDGTTRSRSVPADVLTLTSGVVAIAAADAHTCALTTTGVVKCWGSNSNGQLGDGTTQTRLTPVTVIGLPADIRSIHAGSNRTCAITSASVAKCWGANDYAFPASAATVPADVAGLGGDVVQIAIGEFHSCALTITGAVKCWGSNDEGQLGNRTTTFGAIPSEVWGLGSGIVAITAGYNHSCALGADRSAMCWGWGLYGELGSGTTDNQSVPAPLAGLQANVRSIGAGDTFTCALTISGQAMCWGTNVSGGLGTGSTTPSQSNVPVTVMAIARPPRLANISTRGKVLTGEDVVIGGFIIGGTASKTIVVRARGPSLTAMGVPGALSNPSLQLVRSSDQATIAVNDDWQDASNAADILASGFAPAHPLESAVLMSLPPGAYTAIVSGVAGATGIGMVEIFQVDHPEIPLLNIATRARVLSADEVMIGGFIIQGSAAKTVVVRARGPSLAQYGIADPLANPMLQLVRSSDQAVIAENDDWQSATNAPQLLATGFAPPNAREAAILVTLDPGAYTALVSGVAGRTGVGIVEVFAP